MLVDYIVHWPYKLKRIKFRRYLYLYFELISPYSENVQETEYFFKAKSSKLILIHLYCFVFSRRSMIAGKHFLTCLNLLTFREEISTQESYECLTVIFCRSSQTLMWDRPHNPDYMVDPWAYWIENRWIFVKFWLVYFWWENGNLISVSQCLT